MSKRILRIALLLVLAGAVVGGLFATGVIGRKKAADTLTLYGNVDIRQVDLGFRVAGRVAAMALEEGDPVVAGALLAHLDDRSYQDDLRAAEAQVGQQAATLDKLERGPRPAEISQARASLAERKADLANAELTLVRARQLRSSDVIPQAELDNAQAARDASQARVASAVQALRLLEEGTRQEDIAAGRAALDAAKARLAASQTALLDTRLLAPSDGVILSRVREPGAIVSPSDVVYVLSLNRPVWVRAYVDESHLGRVFPGMEVTVVSDTAHKPHRGRVGFISPVAEFTPKSVETPELRTDLVYRLRIIIDEPDPSLRQGMPVTVHVPVAAQKE